MAAIQSPADHEVLRFFGEAAFEDWRLFEAHFDLSAGSALLVLLLPGTAGALICEQALAERLARDNRLLERIHFPSISEIIRLGERLLDLKVDGVGGVWVSFLCPDSADDAWKAACGKMFALLNQHRNRILKALPVPLIFVGEPWLQQVFREAAPDFWSVRSTVVRLLPHTAPDESRLEGASLQSQSAVTGVEAASDPDYTLQQAHRLANRKELAFQRAELLSRAGAGFRENARLELAESCWREALNALTDASEMKQQPRADAMRALVLNSLSVVLSELGHREEALGKAQEALRIYEKLAKARPDVFLPDVAMSLNNLAGRLSELGRREEALDKAQEAARIYEQLAKARPDAFLPDVAMSLNNLGGMLSALGRREEGLNKAQEATRIREQLAKSHPDVFLPALASSLNNLANRLSDLGRWEEALDKAQEAVRIRAQLAKARPEAFLPNLATSYGVRGTVLRSMERHAEAADSFAQGIRAITPLFQNSPRAFAKLIGSLSDDYRGAIQKAQLQPDDGLLAPVVEVFDTLNHGQTKQSS